MNYPLSAHSKHLSLSKRNIDFKNLLNSTIYNPSNEFFNSSMNLQLSYRTSLILSNSSIQSPSLNFDLSLQQIHSFYNI